MFYGYGFGQNAFLVRATMLGTDTIPLVCLNEVEICAKKSWKAVRTEKRNERLVRDVVKVYPLARIASSRLTAINYAMVNINDEKERKEYIDQVEKDLKNEYEKQITELSMRQGRILIKLVYRECGASTYDIVRKLKGKTSVVFWQTLARIFTFNLKWKYDPEEESEIESIIQSIEKNELAVN